MKLDKKKEESCEHSFVYNKIIDLLRQQVRYVITCSKCGFEPPEGYVRDKRCVKVRL